MSNILKRIQKWFHDNLGRTIYYVEELPLAHDSNGDAFHPSETVKKNKKIMIKGVPLKINI